MQRNTDEAAQARRRRDAWQSTVGATVWLLISAGVILILRRAYVPAGFWSIAMLIAALLELGMLIPVWINLKTRLVEIEGGEEDAAAEY